MINIEEILEKMLFFYDLDSMSQLADKIGVSQPTISKWKARNSILPIKRICKELGIYKEIFKDNNSQEISKNSSDIESENKSDLSKYFTALQSVAIATNKEDELLTDIRELIKKYMQSEV